MIRPHRAILCLVLGLTSSIVIAFLLAAFRPIPMYPRTTMRAFALWDRPWQLTEINEIGVHDVWWFDMGSDDPRPTAIVVESQRATLADRSLTDTPIRLIHSPPAWGTFALAARPNASLGSDTAFGFPFPCLWFSVSANVTNSSGNSTLYGDQLNGGLIVRGSPSARTRDFAAIPTRPIWSHIAVDTAVLGTVWWLLLSLPGPIRRALRRRRGHCPGCNYDLRATPAGSPCPECGRDQRTP